MQTAIFEGGPADGQIRIFANAPETVNWMMPGNPPAAFVYHRHPHDETITFDDPFDPAPEAEIVLEWRYDDTPEAGDDV